MELSPLQLEGYYVRNLKFSLNPAVEKNLALFAPTGLQYMPLEKPDIDPLTINVAARGGPQIDDATSWRFELIVNSNNPTNSNFPYEFEVLLVGYFKANFKNPLGDEEMLIRTNAISILFSTAREILASASSRGPYPGVQLPSVSFVNSTIVQPPKIEPKAQSKTARKTTKKLKKKASEISRKA